jgi:hypothetical protein
MEHCADRGRDGCRKSKRYMPTGWLDVGHVAVCGLLQTYKAFGTDAQRNA